MTLMAKLEGSPETAITPHRAPGRTLLKAILSSVIVWISRDAVPPSVP